MQGTFLIFDMVFYIHTETIQMKSHLTFLDLDLDYVTPDDPAAGIVLCKHIRCNIVCRVVCLIVVFHFVSVLLFYYGLSERDNV